MIRLGLGIVLAMDPVGTSVFISKKVLHSQAPMIAKTRITSHSLMAWAGVDFFLVVDVFCSVT